MRDKLLRTVNVRIHHGEGKGLVSYVDLRGGEFVEANLETLPPVKPDSVVRISLYSLFKAFSNICACPSTVLFVAGCRVTSLISSPNL